MAGLLLAIDFCENESMLRAFAIIRVFITVVKVMVPLLIIIKTTIDLTKAIIASNDNQIKEITTKIPRRLIAGLIIFLIPTLINYIFNALVPMQDTASSFASCTTCMTTASECDTLIDIAHANAEAEKIQFAPLEVEISQEQIDEYFEKARQSQSSTSSGSQGTSQGTTQTTTQTHTVGNGKYFDSNDITKISGLSEQEFIDILQNSTAYKGKAKVYIPLAHDLILAEQNHSVNAFYLIGLYSYESGWLGSTLTKKCNNIGGVRYYGRTYGNGKKQTNCWNNYAGFDSIAEFIDFHANMLQTKYLTPGVDHYHGTSVAAVAKDYGAGNGIDTIIRIATNVSGGNASQ